MHFTGKERTKLSEKESSFLFSPFVSGSLFIFPKLVAVANWEKITPLSHPDWMQPSFARPNFFTISSKKIEAQKTSLIQGVLNNQKRSLIFFDSYVKLGKVEY